MIRDFRKSDLEKFEPNEFSDPGNIKHVFEDDSWWIYTIENKGIKAIICFLEDKPRQWAVFTLLSKDFTARDSVEMRNFMKRAEDVLKPDRLWTASPGSDKTDKWHGFFGFVSEKPKKIRGKSYNIWARGI